MKRNKHKKTLSLQSAMEYLMTYGWAILIITVVLGILFQLGIFNASSFTSRAQPGSCKVQRVGIPGSTLVNLAGTCNMQLPQFVAKFDGASTYVAASEAGMGSTLTLSLWLQSSNYDSKIPFGFLSNAYATFGPDIYIACGAINWNVGDGCANPFPGSSYPNSNWHNLVVTNDFTSNIAKLYVDGQYVSSAAYRNTASTSSNSLYIGRYANGGYVFDGKMANVQIYNASIPASDINRLYLEGIGGAPLDLSYLVAWWPLNGNANDYGGSGNDGVPTGVSFTSQYGK